MQDHKTYAINCFRDEAQAILDLIPLLDDNFDKAVELIYNCKGKCIVTGVGKSGHVGAKIAATLASLGTPSFFLNPLDAYHGDLGMIASEDVVIAISYSGNTDELLRFIPSLTKKGIPIIGISSNPNSLLGRNSTFHLSVKVDHEADPLNLAPTSSTTATLAMGDALACALVKARDFRSEDFAQFHPGGSLGKRLLTRVKDVMVTTDLPIVNPDHKISDTIIEMSKTKLGLSIIMEGDNIVGVVTDGDIRRSMKNNQDNFFELTVGEIMSPHPRIICEDAKLSEAEQIMKKGKVHSLIVVNKKQQLVGVIEALRVYA